VSCRKPVEVTALNAIRCDDCRHTVDDSRIFARNAMLANMTRDLDRYRAAVLVAYHYIEQYRYGKAKATLFDAIAPVATITQTDLDWAEGVLRGDPP
jgi:hypothetical protein